MIKELKIAICLAFALTACPVTDTNSPLAAPGGLKASGADRSVRLEWNPSADPDLKGYTVSVTGSEGAVVAETPVNAPATTVTVGDLTNGSTYTFRVATETKAGKRSPFSSPLEATPGLSGKPPAIPSGLVASAQDGQVLLTWNKNPEFDLKGYTLYFGPTAAKLEQTKTLPASAVDTIVAPLTNATPFFFALEAENTAGQKSPRTEVLASTPQSSLLAPIIEGVSITGYGTSAQVRQGAGSIEVVLRGQRLDTITTAKLLGSFDFTILEKTASSAKLSASVPHGLDVGPRTLSLTSSGGEVALAQAIEITKITSAKNAGLNPSDTTGLGTPNRPFLTLSRALAVAAAGDTVLLGAGIYSAGESWPQSPSNVYPSPNVAAGVSIEGQSSDAGAVLLQGAGASGSSSGLAFAGSATVRNLRLRGFNFALVLRAGTTEARLGLLRLENLSVIENYSGVAVNDAEGLNLARVVVNNNTLGLTTRSVTAIDIGFSEFNSNTEYGINVSARSASPRGTTFSIFGSTVNQNVQGGISVGVDGLSLSSTMVKLNGGYGLELLGKPFFVSFAGATRLEQNGSFQLLDSRRANTGGFIIDRVMIPGMGITAGTVSGPFDSGSWYRISNSGNFIFFQ
jgi:hypothetical protein